jgi:type II secretory pathway component GspD/PulD (secretin)
MSRILRLNFHPILMAAILAVASSGTVFAAETIDIDLGGGAPAAKPAATKAPASPAKAAAPAAKPAAKKAASTAGKSVLDNITVTEEGDETRIEMTGKGLPKPKYIEVKGKYVLDFPGISFTADLPAGAGLAVSIRKGVQPGGITRVVADAPNAKGGKLEALSNGYALVLSSQKDAPVDDEQAAVPEAGAKVVVPAEDKVASKGALEKSIFNRLIGLSLKQTDAGMKVVLTADGPVKYTVRKLARPEKLVVRLHGTKLDVKERVLAQKAGDPALTKGGLMMVESREIGTRLAPIAEIMLTLQPRTVHQISQDLNQVVITLNAPTEEKAVEKVGSLNKIISVDLEDADLNLVLKTLGTEAGFDVDLLTGVDGRVQQRLKNVPLKNALAVLLSPGNYDYEVQGNLLRIGTAAQLKATKGIMPQVMEVIYPGNMTAAQLNSLIRSVLPASNDVTTSIDPARGALVLKGTPSDVEQYKRTMRDLKLDSNESDRITRIVKLNYAEPAAINNILTAYLTPQGRIQTDIRNQSLVIWDVASNMGVLLELIKELDVRLPQVLIESSIVEVSTEKATSLGLTWNASKTGSGDPSISANAILEPNDFVGSMIIGTVRGGFNINATLRALESSNDSRVLSRPRVATASGVAASISTSETVVYTTTQQTIGQGGIVVNTVVVNQLSLPINLNVTPRITDDGRITTQVSASIQSVSGPAVAGVPPTTTQNANTTITVKNGDTIVIGGLVRDIMSERVRKIPFLGSLPILGSLFRSTENAHRKVELIIFITPTLLED